MVVKFFDVNSILIKKSDLLSFNYYSKVYFDESNIFSKIETYEDNKLIFLELFTNDDTKINEILNEYPSSTTFTIHLIKEIKKSYLSCESYEYNIISEIKSGNRIETYKNDIIYPIYSCLLDNNNKRVPTKYYYDLKNNVEYEFDYDENGKFKKLTVLDPTFHYDTDDYSVYPEQIGVGKNYFDFSFENFEYYKEENPIIPVK